MSKYRKKPIVIEAFKFRIDYCPDWFMDKVSTNEIVTFESHCTIKTLEGWMRAEIGDYIIKGIIGEIYPCKKEIFNLTYEKVND